MPAARLVWASHREDDLTIEQLGSACRVVFHAERDLERRWAEEVDLGGNSQFGRQQPGDVTAEPDPGQATNVALDDDQPVVSPNLTGSSIIRAG
ncbi:MAG TPA: hypothetical protein VGG09_04125 [Acidimicrobiales bacterium]|jgi:hypothetical protein